MKKHSVVLLLAIAVFALGLNGACVPIQSARRGAYDVEYISIPENYGKWAASAQIEGRIFERSTKIPLRGSSVKLTGTTVRRTSADPTGYYLIDSITPGTYNVRVEMMGYWPINLEAIEVEAGKVIVIDFYMAQQMLETE